MRFERGLELAECNVAVALEGKPDDSRRLIVHEHDDRADGLRWTIAVILIDVGAGRIAMRDHADFDRSPVAGSSVTLRGAVATRHSLGSVFQSESKPSLSLSYSLHTSS